MQSRQRSGIEAVVNVVVGYTAAVLSQIAIFPLVGIDVPLRVNFLVGAWFTGVSLIRSYTVRRMFTKWEDR